ITNPKNGDIIAMVGGKDYNSENGGNFNVTTARRQPGSTIKVVTYSAALQNGFTAATVIQDTPVSYSSGSQTYKPVNYSGGYRGNVTLRTALANSINVPAVKTLNKIGIDKMVALGKRMGIDTWKDAENYGLSITLGSAEVRMTDMAEVYGSLANGGEKVDLNPILKITNYRGEVLEEKSVRGERVIPKEIAFIISHILSDNRSRSLEFGTNSVLNIPGHTVSVKTGTTDNKRDNWTIGFSKSLLVAVWVGNNDNSPMDPSLTSGITGAAPIWNRIITELLKDSKNEPLSPPSEIVQKQCFGRVEYFVKGTENTVPCRPLSLQPVSPTPNP
ncbi:MAG: penicillin-binding transpeptidase domain-containing protein, partial [Patescibacteria group bacterium]